jgi:hypothetical protein
MFIVSWCELLTWKTTLTRLMLEHDTAKYVDGAEYKPNTGGSTPERLDKGRTVDDYHLVDHSR